MVSLVPNSGVASIIVVVGFAVLGFFGGTIHKGPSQIALSRLADARKALVQEYELKSEAQTKLDNIKAKFDSKRDTLLHLYEELGSLSAIRTIARTSEMPKLARVRSPRSNTIQKAPRCQDKDLPAHVYSSLPVYVFVCGIEGAGHHAIETVLGHLGSKYDIAVTTYNPGLHSFAKHPNVSRAYQFPTIDIERHKRTFANFLKGPKVHGSNLIFDTRNSYPEGFGVGSLGHPDLAFLSKLDGVLFELRVLVLVRDPVKSVLSAVRRFKVQEFQYKNYQYQARVVQESLTMINNGLATVPCGKSLIVPYEQLLKNPTAFAPKLADLFGIHVDDLKDCFGELKPQKNKKELEGDVARMSDELSDFFKVQKRLWPNIIDFDNHPSIDIQRAKATMLDHPRNDLNISIDDTEQTTTVIQPKATRSPKKLAMSSKPRKGYLKVTWHTNLGFNNMRFIMEEALYLAKLLNRKLILAPRLRMRRCMDSEICESTDCTIVKDNYWCPLTAFLSWSALSSAGAVIIQQERTFMHGKTLHEVDKAFDDMFNKSNLYLEKLTPTIKASIDSNGLVKDGKSLKFPYHKFQLGCELSYFRTKKLTWDSTKESHRAQKIKGFVDEYGKDDAHILHLKGIPHFIGLTPTFWSSERSLNDSEAVWKSGVAYHASVVATAKMVSNQLIKMGSGNVKTYMCVHLRRGDFVSAGWLGEAKDLALVKKNILKRQAEGEMIYMATDEQNVSTLRDFRDSGVRTWADFQSSVAENAKGKHAKMIAFEDYVGLVEQMICAKARVFVGSKCSSFTGGILNLRRNILGDHNYYITTK